MSARPIRVLQLGSPTGLYGAERWILALVKHLSTAQIESIVGTIKDAPGEAPPLCQQAAALGIRTVVFESQGRLSLKAIGLLREFVRSNRIDVLHTHGYKTDILGWLGTWGTPCKVITTPHGWSADAGVTLMVYEALDRIAFYGLDAVVPLSADLHAGLRRLPGLSRKLHLIENGLDISELDSTHTLAPELIRCRDSGCRVIGYIGQLIPRKGIETLIRAFAALQFENRVLCIVGEGPQRSDLESLVRRMGEGERVRFFGYRPDRIALLKGFDVFVLSSSLEGIPRCVLEAMAAGIPVIGSDIPGCRELIEAGKTGLLFEPGDVGGLTAALQRIFADDRERMVLAHAASLLVRTRFSAEVMAARYADLYARLLLDVQHRAVAGSP